MENRSDSEGWVRQGYQKAAQLIGKTKRVGNIAYYSADLGLSVWGMGRTVISPTARKLFRHIKNDYMRGIRTMTGKALTLEIAVDLITGKNLLWEIEKKDEHDH